jgi:hypothetical protein
MSASAQLNLQVQALPVFGIADPAFLCEFQPNAFFAHIPAGREAIKDSSPVREADYAGLAAGGR